MSPVMLDVLQSCPKKLFVVGDTHQQIYSFRHAVDAMTKLDADQVLELSQSFRFGPQIAELAQALIQEAKSIPGFRIRGNTAVASRASLYGRHESHRDVRSATVLARTNLGLFATALDLRKKGIALRFEKDMAPVLGRILDVMHVARGAPEQARDTFVRSFPSLEDIEKYAEETQDLGLAQTCKIVTQYERELPKVAYDLIKLCGDSRPQEHEAVTLTTVHGAKGKEYPRVIIDTDLPLHLERALDSDVAAQDEINLAYVAIYPSPNRTAPAGGATSHTGEQMEVYAFGLGSRPIKERARATSIHISSKAPKTEAGSRGAEMGSRPDRRNDPWRWKDRRDGSKKMLGGSKGPGRQSVGELLKSQVMWVSDCACGVVRRVTL